MTPVLPFFLLPTAEIAAPAATAADLAILDAVYHAAGIEAAEDPSPLTPEEQAEVDALGAFVDRLVGRR